MRLKTFKQLLVLSLMFVLILVPRLGHTPSFPDWFCMYKFEKPKRDNLSQLINKVSADYDLDKEYAKKIVIFVKKNSYKDFPTVKDILAIIGIESAFNPAAENKGAYGLMQIQHFWFRKLIPELESLYDPFINMSLGISTLREYFVKLNGSKDDAIIAYQAGIGNFLSGEYTNEYLNRYRQELTRYE